MRSWGRVWVRCPDWDYLKYHHLSLRQLTRSLPHPVTLRQVCYMSCLLKSRVWKRVNIGTEKAGTMASVRITAGSFSFQLKRFLLRGDPPPWKAAPTFYHTPSEHLQPSEVILCLSLSLFFFLSFVLLGPHPRHMEVPRLEGPIGATTASLHHSHSNVRSEQSLRPTPRLTATSDP